MKLSDFAINELIKIVIGDVPYSKYRKGKELVELFNSFSCRDVYDYSKGGLPFIDSNSNRSPSRTEYAKDRLTKLNGKQELRLLLSTVISEADDIQECAKEVNDIIIPEGFNVSVVDKEVTIIGGIVKVENKPNNEASFKENESKILKALDEAKLTIYVSVAWISNEKLVNKLKEKKSEGLDVKIIINNDGINKKHCPDFEDLQVFAKRGDNGGFMHNKFCVIDNQVVVHGSYNWSTNAEYKNDETITVVIGDIKLATEFSLQFKNLLQNSTVFNKQ